MARARDWRRILVLAGLLFLAGRSGVQAAPCAVCRLPLGDSFYWMEHPSLAEKQAVCTSCAGLETHCWACRLPVKDEFLKLDDGRLLCPIHARDAVLTQQDAEAVFLEAKRGMMALLRDCGSLPDRNITLQLVDAPQMTKQIEGIRLATTPTNAVGLTRTRREGTALTHVIYIMSGQNRARCLATGAHEYTHAWMDENVPQERVLDPSAIEGFCELAAYKLMADLNERTEMKYILANAYTRGQVDLFVKAEDSLRFHRIVQWVKSGVGDRIKPDNTEAVLDLKQAPAVTPAWPQAVPTKVPDTLQLKGISGRPDRRLALINDQTFEEGETASVRVGLKKVQARCVCITEKSVILELPATNERRELLLHAE